MAELAGKPSAHRYNACPSGILAARGADAAVRLLGDAERMAADLAKVPFAALSCAFYPANGRRGCVAITGLP